MVLVLHEIVLGRPQVRHRIQMIQACRIQESGEVRRVFRRIHCDLDAAVRDYGKGSFGVASRPPQDSTSWMPGTGKVMEVHPFALQSVCESINCDRLIPSSALG
jgi:hypothetical protein